MAQTKEEHRDWKKEWRKRNPDKVLAAQRRYYAKHRGSDTMRSRRIRRRLRMRQYILDFFGDKCVRCGFTDGRALQMDHINGRQGVTKMNIDKRYIYLKNNPKEARQVYQMLCANCNFIKREENLEYYYHGRPPISSKQDV